MRFIKRTWPLLGCTMLTACHTPSSQDIGRMVLVSAPVWFLLGWLALGFLLKAWRPVLDGRGIGLAMSWRPSMVAGIILVLAAVFGAATMTPDGWDFFLVGSQAEDHRSEQYWTYALQIGLGYVSVALVIWRIWFAFRKPGSFTWALIAVMALYWLPAVALALGLAAGNLGSSIVLGYWYALLPGFLGIPTMVVLFVLVVGVPRFGRQAGGSSVPPVET